MNHYPNGFQSCLHPCPRCNQVWLTKSIPVCGQCSGFDTFSRRFEPPMLTKAPERADGAKVAEVFGLVKATPPRYIEPEKAEVIATPLPPADPDEILRPAKSSRVPRLYATGWIGEE